MSHPARRRRFKLLGSVSRVPASFSAETDRETVIASLPCSPVYPLSDDDRERAGLAETTADYHAYAEPQTTAVSDEMYFSLSSTEYRIRHVSLWPVHDPQFMELFLSR